MHHFPDAYHLYNMFFFLNIHISYIYIKHFETLDSDRPIDATYSQSISSVSYHMYQSLTTIDDDTVIQRPLLLTVCLSANHQQSSNKVCTDINTDGCLIGTRTTYFYTYTHTCIALTQCAP